MIKITISENKDAQAITLKVKGHANHDDIGKDIVCASASILTYTIAQYITFMYDKHQLKKKPTISLAEGDTEITVKPKADFYTEALHAYLVAGVGYSLLAHNYPQNVDYKGFE